MDADAGHKRKIIAFVGGLDLCMGRYDTPQHPLFKTLQTVHQDDYHNPNFTVIIQINALLMLNFCCYFTFGNCIIHYLSLPLRSSTSHAHSCVSASSTGTQKHVKAPGCIVGSFIIFQI